MQGTIK